MVKVAVFFLLIFGSTITWPECEKYLQDYQVQNLHFQFLLKIIPWS